MGQSNSKPAQKNIVQVHPSPQQAEKRLIIGNTPRHATTDFFLPMPDADTISDLFKDADQKSVHFIRSGVGVGKSTIANFLCQKFEKKFVIIKGNNGIANWRK